MKRFFGNIRARIARALDALVGPLFKRVRTALEPMLAQARGRYKKLESRERLLLKALALVFGVVFIYDFIYLPVQSLRENLRVSVKERHAQLGEVRALVDTYLERQAQLKFAEKRMLAGGKDFSLFSALEGTLTRSVGRDRLASISPRPDRKISGGFIEHSVELSLTGVNLKQIVDALYGVRHLPVPVAVSSIHITRRSGDTHSYDVQMTCVAVVRNG